MKEGGAAVRTKKAGILTKIVVLALLIAATVTLLRMHRQILRIWNVILKKGRRS